MSQGPIDLPKDESTWKATQIRKSTINFSALNIIQCAVPPDEYSRVSMCRFAKEIWDKFLLIYEGTPKVKETKANLLTTEYEMFKMNPDEPIYDMFARFM